MSFMNYTKESRVRERQTPVTEICLSDVPKVKYKKSNYQLKQKIHETWLVDRLYANMKPVTSEQAGGHLSTVSVLTVIYFLSQ